MNIWSLCGGEGGWGTNGINLLYICYIYERRIVVKRDLRFHIFFSFFYISRADISFFGVNINYYLLSARLLGEGNIYSEEICLFLGGVGKGGGFSGGIKKVRKTIRCLLIC